MANGSYSISTTNSYIVGTVTWSETNVNNANNTSDVYVEMRLSRTNGYETSGSGSFTVNVNGTDVTNKPSFTITQNSNTLMVAGTVYNIAHNADGTKSVPISWAGTSDVFNVTGGSGTITLSTIPRASTLTSAVSWRAAVDIFTVSINRASTDFHHSIQINVQKSDGTWQYIGARDNYQTSGTFDFTTAENTTIYQTINKANSIPSWIRLITFDSSNNTVGYNDYYGNVFSNYAGTVSFNDFNIGDSVSATMGSYTTGFTYDVQFTFGSFTKTFSNVTSSPSFTWTSSDKTSMYNVIPNANSGTGTANVSTYYNGVLIQNATSKSFTAYVTNSNPTFGTGYTYADTNSTTTGITGDSTKIIQNKSSVTVTLPATAKATAINGATMSKYIANLNGVEITQNYSTSDITFAFNTVTASSDVTLSIKAIDSRGNSTTTTMTVTVIPYSIPIINSTVTRANGFDASTTLTMSGSISPLTISGVNKNTIQNLQYRYKSTQVSSGATWDTWTNFTYTTSGANYTATDVTLTLDNAQSWNVEVSVTDKFGITISALVVSQGVPFVAFDQVKKSMGLGKFPTGTGTLETASDAIIGGNLQVNNKPYVTELTATIPASAGWYRIATSASGIANNMGEFEIIAPLTSHHATAKVLASIEYANASYSGYTSLTQLNYSNYNTASTAAITQVRIVYNTTYTNNYAYLEVYCPNASSFSMTARMIGGTGWTLLAPNTTGSIPTGYTSQTITLQSGGLVASGKLFENGNVPVSPTSTIQMFAGSTAPTGWLICDGSAVSRTTYSALYSAIGTAFGAGDGSTTFNIPNLKGNVPVGLDSSQTEFNTLGKTGGEKTHLLTTGEMPSHTHTVSGAGTSYKLSSSSYVTAGTDNGLQTGYATQTTSSAGSGTAHNNLQPYITLNYIIRT